jgi:hypothetical protein
MALPVAITEFQNRFASRDGCHHIAGLVAVPPKAKGMAEFMQSRGLNCWLGLARADHHGHLWFHLPASLALHLQ